MRVRHEATCIDPAAKTVDISDLTTGERSSESYDKLILATGARPRRDEPAGVVPVLSLRTVSDADAIHAAVATPSTPAVVVGGGYTGLEAVENLVARGAVVTLVQRGRQLLSPLDVEMASPIAEVLRGHSVDVRLGAEIARVEVNAVVLTDGTHVPAALIVDASGVVPKSALAAEAGLQIGETGGIWVDENNRTSAPGRLRCRRRRRED